MPYVLATINKGGFIKLLDRHTVVHRETLSIHTSGESCFSRIDGAKSNLANVNIKGDQELKIALALRKDGGVESIWVFPDSETELKQRLRIWSGCYGAWPVKKFQEVESGRQEDKANQPELSRPVSVPCEW